MHKIIIDAIMHKKATKPIDSDRVDVADFERLRALSGLTRSELCARAGINVGTYSRWLKYARGDRDGSCPNMRSFNAVKSVLIDALAQHGHCVAA